MPKEWDGSWTPRFLTAREVSDDFGNRMRIRRCSKCRHWLPETVENFTIKQRGRDGSITQYDWQCRPCRRVSAQGTRDRIPFERRRVIYRRRYERERASAEMTAKRRARQAAAQRRYRERHPERERANKRRWQAKKIATDPAWYEERKARLRLTYAMRRHEQGARPDAQRAQPGGPELAVAPLLAVIERYLQRVRWMGGEDDHEASALERLSLVPRHLYAWRRDERSSVRFDLADRVLSNLELNWFDVWQKPANGHVSGRPEDVLAYIAEAEVYIKACLAFEGELVD